MPIATHSVPGGPSSPGVPAGGAPPEPSSLLEEVPEGERGATLGVDTCEQ